MGKKDSPMSFTSCATSRSSLSKRLVTSKVQRPLHFLPNVRLLAQTDPDPERHARNRSSFAKYLERREHMRLNSESLSSSFLKRSTSPDSDLSLSSKKTRNSENNSEGDNDNQTDVSQTQPSNHNTPHKEGFTARLLKSIAEQRRGKKKVSIDVVVDSPPVTAVSSSTTSVDNFCQSQGNDCASEPLDQTSITNPAANEKQPDDDVVIVLDSESEDNMEPTNTTASHSHASSPFVSNTASEDVIDVDHYSHNLNHSNSNPSSVEVEIEPIVTLNGTDSDFCYLLPVGKSSTSISTYLIQSLRTCPAFRAYLESDEAFLNARARATSEKMVYRPEVNVNAAGCLNIMVDAMELTFEGLCIPQPRLSGRLITRFSYEPQLPASDKSDSQIFANRISFQHDQSSRRPLLPPNISIDNFSLLCLNPGAYVNDVVIDFYLTYLQYEVMSPNQRQFSHRFGCFFYNKLLDAKLSKEQRHLAGSSWTRRINLFEKDFLFIPVLQSSHWFLCIICFPWLAGTVDYIKRFADNPGLGTQDVSLNLDTSNSQSFIEFRRARVRELNKEGVQPMPCIMIFDSLTGQKHRALNVSVLRDFLQMEWNKKYADAHGPIVFNKDTIRGYIARVFPQRNGCDCGVYCLSYAEHFIRSPVKTFSKHHFETTHICPDENELDGMKIRANIQDLIISKYHSRQ